MSRKKDQSTIDDAALTVAGEGCGSLMLLQASMPVHLKLKEEESHHDYLDRVAGPFMEFLVGRAMLENDGMAMGALTRLFEKKMDAQVRLEQIRTAKGSLKQTLTGSAGAIGRMAGMSSIDAVMSGKKRPSDVAGGL